MNKEIKYKYKLDLKEVIQKQRDGNIGIEELSKLIADKINELEVEEKDDQDGLINVEDMFKDVKTTEDYDNAMNELINWCERWEEGIEDGGLFKTGMTYRCKLSIKNTKVGKGEESKEMTVLGVKRDEYDSEWFNLFLDGQTLRIENDRVKWVIDEEQLSPIALVSKEREKSYDRKFDWITSITIKGTKESITTLLYNIGIGSAEKEVEPKWRQKSQYEF